MLLSGCKGGLPQTSPQETVSEADLARATAAEIRKHIGVAETPLPSQVMCGIEILPSDILKGVWPYVQTQFENRDVRGLAALINVEGPWQKTMWWGEMVEAFLWHFRDQRPIKLAGTDQALLALKRLTVIRENGRDTRVYAASALVFDDTELALRTLKEEYAKFTVAGSDDHGWRDPPACGPALNRIRFRAPEEITSTSEAAKRLGYRGITVHLDSKTNRERLAEAANRYNLQLRKALDLSHSQRFEESEDWPEQQNRLVAIWEDVRKNWKAPAPPKGGYGQLFGTLPAAKEEGPKPEPK